ncbi:unnamed protein product [Meganyctiphanes norvegica]|uniref:MAM domain-containing protein n=1 Tax=Meganyctiphanes norvegica TaxID=48144 RepID=A0AAV2S427_MEGNR
MDLKWITLVSLLVLQYSYIECADQDADDSTKQVPAVSSPPTGGAEEGASNRRRPLTDPEHEYSGKAQASEGLYFDTADWSKEAEKWMFKGGAWGLVSLPDDKHPGIADPPVPGPVLIAEGSSMKKVIVSRSLSGLENVSLHFSYFLTNNPRSPPTLEVYQLKGNDNSLVWPSLAEDGNVGYGQWIDGRVDILPYNGDFEIKFIGQRIVDKNDIGLDDIVLRGNFMKNAEGEGNLRAEDNDNQTTSFATQNDNDNESNNTQSELTTVSSENKINVTMGNNTGTEDEVSNNPSNVTENPAVINETGIGGIAGTDSPPTEEGWGIFKIFLTISVLGGCVLLYLYWRQRRLQDDEIPVFSRGPTIDYYNPTFEDDVSADEGLTGRGVPSNYKSFH